MSAPTPFPAGYVSAIAATGFTLTLTAVPTSPAVQADLWTRPLGGVAAWTSQGSASDVGDTIAVTGLTADAPLEWRLTAQSLGSPQFSDVSDGTHGIVTPSSSLWPTLLSTLSTVMLGAGLTAVYSGIAPPPNYEPAIAFLRTQPEIVRRSATDAETVEYPVEVEIRLREVSDTGELRTADVATYQRAARNALHQRGAETFPGIAGLELINVDVRTKDDARGGADEYADETRARMVVRFLVNEARGW